MDKASPQLKNGYTAIANETVDALAKIRIPGVEMQCLIFILRKTYGFNKKKDFIALSQFVKGTGLIKQHITRALSSLESKKIILVTNKGYAITNKGYTSGHVYEFNKNYKQWVPLPKKVTLPKMVKGITNNGYKSQPIMVTPKVECTKATITKVKELYVEIVQYLNKKTKKQFKPSNRKTQSLINSRIKEGFTESDFYQVIDNKYAKWFTDPKMCEYLRPETLFGTKFESYLNDVPHPLQGKVSAKTIKNIQTLENWEPLE